MERWAIIEDFPNYKINTEGKIINTINNREKIYAHRIRSGYYYVALFNNKFEKSVGVHRLVAMSFIPNPLNKPCVNHIDGNKLNNCVDNLEWVTWSENKIHADQNGLSKIIPVAQYDLSDNLIRIWDSMSVASKVLNININRICSCCRGNCKQGGGFKWKYCK